jgi:hypothetical protein
MKFVFAEVRTQKRFVIISRYEQISGYRSCRPLKPNRCAISRVRFRHFAQRRGARRSCGCRKLNRNRTDLCADRFLCGLAYGAAAPRRVGTGRPTLMLDNRVMTRGDVIAAERCRFTPEIAELELSLHHAGFGVRPAWYSLEK